MKTVRPWLLAIVALSVLPSCSLMQRWGVARPELQVLSEERTTINGEVYVTRRYSVAGSKETFTESVQQRAAWANSTGAFTSQPMVTTKRFLE